MTLEKCIQHILQTETEQKYQSKPGCWPEVSQLTRSCELSISWLHMAIMILPSHCCILLNDRYASRWFYKAAKKI